jgi:hypothetical protein
MGLDLEVLFKMSSQQLRNNSTLNTKEPNRDVNVYKQSKGILQYKDLYVMI